MYAPSMLYAFKLGPFETHEGFFTAYVGMTPDKALPPMFADRSADALKVLAGQVKGLDLRCEPGLARAGRAIGFEASPAPEWVIGPRAMLAWSLAMGDAAANLLGAPIPEFLAASAAFMKAKPWRHWGNDDVVALQIRGSHEKEYEGSIMGCAGEAYGLALYEEKGAVRKLGQLVEQGRMRDAASLRSIAVTMDDEPAWAVKALGAAFGVARVPVPVTVANGRADPVDAIDLAVLTAGLRAVTQLTPKRTEASAGLEVAGGSRKKVVKLVATARVSAVR